MISSLNPNTQQFLNSLNGIQDRLTRAQRQISTGLRVAEVSDDPDQIATILAARQNLASTQQIQSNLGRNKAEVDGGEQALQNATQLFERAQTLGAEGSSDTQTADTRASIAQEIGSILDQLVGLAGTTIEGRYIFSGDADQTAPYSIDLTQDPPVSAYQGSASTRLAQHPNGTTFPIAHTAQEIFDSSDPTTSVFGTLNALRQALLSNDTAAIQTAQGALTTADSYLNRQLASYGTTQDKIADATDFGQNLQVSLQAQLSNLTEADLATAIIDQTTAQTQQQAALQSWAQLPRTTLFDYLG